jgi:hypothetical protein
MNSSIEGHVNIPYSDQLNTGRGRMPLIRIVVLLVCCSCMSMYFWTGISAAADTGMDCLIGAHYEWWSGGNDVKGMQLYVPIEVESKYKDFSLQILGAYADTTMTPSGSASRSLSSFTDTKLNLSYTLENKLPFDMLFGLGFNLPTGYTDLKEKDLVLIVPPELMSITTYGEGLNINPTLIISKEWEKWVAGVGLGYTWRGKYDYSYELPDYNPGDIFTATAEADYGFTDTLNGRLFGEYASCGKDTVEGDDYYKEGSLTLIGTGLKYTMPAWEIKTSISGLFHGNGKYATDTSIPIGGKKDHGNALVGGLNYRYFLNNNTTLLSEFDFLAIAENNYPKDSPYYAGIRQKATITGGIERTFTKNIKGSLDMSLFTMKDKRNWYHPDDDLSFKGFSIGCTITVRL